MKKPTFADRLIARVTRRPPDFIVGGKDNPYLLRWYLTPWRSWAKYNERQTGWARVKAFVARALPNVYLHKFLRDDDDRALHDHPWPWCSILLRGCYIEHTIAAGGIHRREVRIPGTVKFALPSKAHRVELLPNTANPANAFDTWPRVPCWTLFIMGPKVREWGFHCPERGWVHWQDFVAADDVGAIGRGCGEP